MEKNFLERRENTNYESTSKLAQIISFKAFLKKWREYNFKFASSNENYTLILLTPLEFYSLSQNLNNFSMNHIEGNFQNRLLQSLRNIDYITIYQQYIYLILLKTNSQNAGKIMERVAKNLSLQEITYENIKLNPSIKFNLANASQINNLSFKTVLLLLGFEQNSQHHNLERLWYQNIKKTQLISPSFNSWLSRYANNSLIYKNKSEFANISQAIDTWKNNSLVNLIEISQDKYQNFVNQIAIINNENYAGLNQHKCQELLANLGLNIDITDYYYDADTSSSIYLVTKVIGN